MMIIGTASCIRKASDVYYQQSRYEKYHEKYIYGVEKWELAKSCGVDDKKCKKLSGISKSTYYRHKEILSNLRRGISPQSKRPKRTRTKNWGKLESNLVLHLRKKEPSWGKQKIAKVLNRNHGIKISESTVGRILKILRERGLITKSVSAVRTKKKRNFNRHAIPWWFKDYKTFEIGERVQIDHMTAIKNQTTCKHFQAWDRKSKYIDADVFSNATSKSAKTFLHNFISNAPFPIKSIQVDGGSEFRGDLEDACAELSIPLIVLPPAKPTYNGGVERGNRIFREEFYARKDIISDSIGAIRYDLKQQVKKYNTYRPHSGLNLLTPMEYINNNLVSSC